MTDPVKIELPPHDPIASTLSAADDRIVVSEWLPPQEGIVPRIRIGRRWVSILWALPIGAAALVLAIALAQNLRELPSIQTVIKSYPGIAQSAPSVDSGFPWLQLQHFLNMLFMMFIIRAGIQILADHPRLYWTRDCTPGTEWFRFFQYPVPEGRI
jgi:methionine sulfoxide reductase catalytic subunit